MSSDTVPDAFRQQLAPFALTMAVNAPALRRSPRKKRPLKERSLSPLTPTDKESDHSEDTEEPRPRPSPKKRKRGYAPPETYAHLRALQDHLKEDLHVLFCGINPGYKSASIGHHFANPSNHFWRCLHRSGLTSVLVPPKEDFTLPELYNLGLTNLVDRPSSEAAELSKRELIASVPTFLTKVSKYRPRVVCFVGIGIWDIVEAAFRKMVVVQGASPRKKQKTDKPPKRVLCLQPYKMLHPTGAETYFFAVPSTSGRVISHQLNDKIKLFAELKVRVEEVGRGELDTAHMQVVNTQSSGA